MPWWVRCLFWFFGVWAGLLLVAILVAVSRATLDILGIWQWNQP
jgi:hypothetical protein